MPHVVFVAPFLLETTLRFVRATAELAGVRLSLITQERPERLPADLLAHRPWVEPVADALDPEQILAAVERLTRRGGRVHRLLGALEELQVPLGEVRRRAGIEGPDDETARNFRDKARMKAILRAAGVGCARCALVHSAAEALARAPEIGFPLVVKPPDGAGARQTFRVDGPDELEAAVRALPPAPGRPMLLEEFVVGEEHSFDAVSIRGEPVWHSLTHYLPAPLEVLENPWIQWCVLLPREIDHPRYDDIRREAAAALRALGMQTGLSHMEWFRRPDGSIAISEVGARPPGAQFTSLISWAHDFDLYAAWARLMVYEEFSRPARKFAAGAAYVRGQGRGRVRAVHGVEAIVRELGPLIVESRLPRPGQPHGTGYEGDGYVILRHPDTDVVRRGLAFIVRTIRVEIESEARIVP